MLDKNTPVTIRQRVRVVTQRFYHQRVVCRNVRSLQEFDSEFRSRIDQGLAEANANKSLFENGTQQTNLPLSPRNGGLSR